MMASSRTHRTTASPNNILYELMLYTEWNQESDVTRSIYKSRDQQSSLGYYIWRPWEYLRKYESLLDEVANSQSSLLGWHFAIGAVGTVLAVLQDTHLEIRTSRDDFSSIIGKATVARDSYQQWRQLCWSPDCSVLALAFSNGAVSFYDLLGSNLFSIPPESGKESQPWQPELSLAGMFFITARVKNQKWPYELILVDHGGSLRSYYVSPSDGVLEFHRYSFSKAGVSAVCWDHFHNLLLVASTPQHTHLDLKTEAVGWGVSAYRLVNDYPYYRLAVPSPEDLARVESQAGLMSWFKSLYTYRTFSVVFKMALSPDGKHLTCVHTCGQVSIWLLPSLRLHRVWGLKEQPNFDVQSDIMKKKSRGYQLEDFLPVDVSWWADQNVMIARKNGAVSVCELSGLHNLLGETPEFVHGEPRLSPVSTHKGVLVLECETSSNQEGNESSDEEESLLNKSTALIQSTFYLITDMERFQPKRKRTKIQRRTYRLLGIKSTTPDELFSRKIDAGEFEEALHLAQVYDLDSDRVYQSQWRTSPVSEESISAYLSKISKKRWVFEECAERIPDSLSAAKQLIEFGLKITSLSALADLSTEGGDFDEEKVLSLPPESVSDEQKCLILTRRTLLRFSDRLYTYQQITNSSEEAYDREVYDKFRRQPICLSAVELAQQSDHHAVGLLLSYQTQEALPYWLTTLSNFPETTSPASYKHLLPECSFDGEVFPWEHSQIRSPDWSEDSKFDVLEPEEDLTEYDMPPRDAPLTAALLEEWYRNRIYELELRSNMVDQPLELVRLARERNITGLDSLFNELVTLDVLVYDVGVEDISLRDLEVMTPLQKAEALMSQSAENDFVVNLRHRLVPFLQRCEKLQSLSRKQLLTQFLANIGSTDLTCPLKLFEYCSVEPCNALVQNTEELLQLALATVYAYSGTDQLDKAEAILKSLPTLPLGPSAKALCKEVSAAVDELRVAMVLKQRGHPLSLLYLHHHRDSFDTAKALFLDLSMATSNRVLSAGEADWDQLLQDLLLLQRLLFTCVPLQLCYEVHAAGVLSSGNTAVIRTAVRSLCCHSEEQHRKPLSLQQSVSLVLTAAEQYFDSASTLTDPNIALARACLNLITEEHKELQEEKDLIAALQLLNDFKISLLPMQVRLCSDRMKLIESCLSSRPSAYKNYHKLLSLAHKLRICGSDSRQREGIILVKVANIAFEAGDYRQCAEICQQLVERRHATGWQPAQRLGQCEDYWEINTRQRLVAFALVHCPDDKLQDLLQTRCNLEYKRLQVYIQEQTGPAETPSEDEDFVDAVTSPQSPTREFLPQLSSTIYNTSKLITQLTNSGFWKEKLLNKESGKDNQSRRETTMTEQGFHEFYHSLHSRCHVSALSPQYCGETLDWRQYNIMQAVLQVSLLQQEQLPSHLIKDNDSVLVRFASLVTPEDSCVGLAALLALAKPEDSDQCFSCLPLTLVTLQLAVYLYALLKALRQHPEAFLWTPDQVLCYAEAGAEEDDPISQLLTKALKQLMNVEQSKQVEQLNCGVNVRRFAWDQQYKTDSILGLAMCEEPEKLDAALALGAEHGVAGWEIVFCHTQSLLLSNSHHLTQRLADNRLTQLLTEQADSVVKRLEENVFATLSGVNYNQLINYYTVLQTVAANTAVHGLLPRDHIKLIKKVKATSSDIDYGRIVSRPSEILEALRPALRKDTVAGVAKLLKELLKALPSIQPHVSVSSLYMEWAVAQFKAECLSPTCRNVMEQFTALQTYFQKMSGDDLLCFVKRAIFCHQSVTQLDPDTRLSMMNMVMRHGFQQHDANEDPSFQKIQALKEYLHQVWELENPSLKTLRNYLIRLDEACGDSDAVSTIIQTALLDASVPSHVLQKIAKLMNKKTLSGYVTDLLHSLPPQPLILTTVLQRVEDCLAQAEKGDSWSILIGPITERLELPENVRKQAAQITKRLGSNYSEELEALRLRTEAVLRTPVSLSQVSDQNCRYLLYKELLSEAETWDSLHTLSLLLTAWPDVDTSWYLELIETMAEVPNSEAFPVLQKLFRKNKFTEEEMLHLVSRLEDCDELFTINVCIISDFKSLHLKAVDLLSKLPREAELSRDLVKRLVERELLSNLSKTPVFEQTLSTVSTLDAESRERAVSQLKSAGLLNEADTLQCDLST